MATKPENLDDITTIILCGGNALRMQGTDKPLVPVTHNGRSKPMVDHVIAATSKHSPVLISANRNHHHYAQRGPVIADADLGVVAQGPLMGVLAGLLNTSTPWLLVCPGDAPYLDEDWHHPLAKQAAIANPNVQAITVHDGTRLQPLHTLVRTALDEHLLAYLVRGQRSAIGWLNTLHVLPVPCAPANQFASVNRFEDLRSDAS
jgi:molybdopterin-guanine dinucleotide biosynthesis protein A